MARIAEHAFHAAAGPLEDPIYADPDFASDFFATVRVSMEGLVGDAGYGALLGAFGPALLDPTGSRPPARQADGMGTATMIRHPRDLRAIPNNAILQQLGWMANTLQGLGVAAARHPETFPDLRAAAAGSAARSTSPGMRWRIPISTCCAPWWARSIRAPGSIAPPTPSGPAGGRR